MRNCIDSQNIESVERKKEAKEKINAAKDKVTLKSTKSLQFNFENTSFILKPFCCRRNN